MGSNSPTMRKVVVVVVAWELTYCEIKHFSVVGLEL
jgi:hypothetical protein